MRNKFINNFKRDLEMYLDSTSTSNISIDTLADLGITIIFHMVTQTKNFTSEEYEKVINTKLAKHANKAIVLNIDNYYSITFQVL